jgi:ribosomal-protein-alanine N-acetyltransferase
MKRAVSMKILPMAPVHIPACAAILSESEPWKRLGERFDFARTLSRERQNGQTHVLIVDKEVVGFIVFTPYPVFARGGYLRAIGVDPLKRRQGFGKKLMRFAEKTTVRFSPNLYLCVSSFNRKAQVFYKNLGYIRIGKIPDLLIQGASEHVYWKRLSQFKTKTRRA